MIITIQSNNNFNLSPHSLYLYIYIMKIVNIRF